MTLCPRCQKRNPDEAARCQYCGALIIRAPATAAGQPEFPARARSVPSRTSGMAIASMVLGLLGLFSLGILALVGLILGIVGLRQIGRSEGRLQGQALAVGGIVVSGLVLAVMFLFVPIVAAVLLPVFAQAREKARASVCITHLRLLGRAMSLYNEDYDGHWPRRQNWGDSVLPYVRTPQGQTATIFFQCPSLPNQRGAYAYNGLMSGVPDGWIAEPSTTAVLFDSHGGWNQSGGAAAADPRHGDGLYMLFAAGNTRWMRSLDGVGWKPHPPAAPAGRRGRRRRIRPRRE
jgi:hypothetical protein